MQSINQEGYVKHISREISAAWAIAKKDMRIYYLKSNIIVAGILFPLFMFLAFAIGKNASPGTLIPGLISITLMFSSSQIEPVSIPMERRVKTFERLLSAPISLYSLVFGESLSGFFYSLGIACLPLVVGVIILSTPIVHPAVLVISMIFTPISKVKHGESPVVVVFVADPLQITGLVTLVGAIREGTDSVRVPPMVACQQIGAFVYDEAKKSVHGQYSDTLTLPQGRTWERPSQRTC
jgi:hypothetical protein